MPLVTLLNGFHSLVGVVPHFRMMGLESEAEYFWWCLGFSVKWQRRWCVKYGRSRRLVEKDQAKWGRSLCEVYLGILVVRKRLSKSIPIEFMFSNVMKKAWTDDLDKAFWLANILGMICGGREVFYPKERKWRLGKFAYKLQTIFRKRKAGIPYGTMQWSKKIHATYGAMVQWRESHS